MPGGGIAGVASVAPPCVHVDIGIHAAGRIGDDARARECFGDQRRHMRVHRPGQILLAGGAELAAGHEHDIGKLRQRVDLLAVEQIGRDAFDARGGKRSRATLFVEARDADHAPVRRRALGEPRQRRPDLAADAEDDEIAGEPAELGEQAGDGVVITSSRCATSRKRSGSAATGCITAAPADFAVCGELTERLRPAMMARSAFLAASAERVASTARMRSCTKASFQITGGGRTKG